MDLLLKNKTAFISGSTQGIGYAIADKLAQEGVNIIINGRQQGKVTVALNKLSIKYPNVKVSGIIADFSQPDDIANKLYLLDEVDILVNNVGIFQQREFHNTTDEDWLYNFNLNVLSGAKLSQYLLPKMLSNNFGRILFIGSEFSINVNSNSIQYGVTKSAVTALSNGLSKLTKGTEVTVNTILAGATYSDGVAYAVKEYAQMQNMKEEQMKKSFFQRANPDSLLERFLEPEEIANVALFLASPLSLSINGASIRADSGNLRVV